jgi:hypothetical protein
MNWRVMRLLILLFMVTATGMMASDEPAARDTLRGIKKVEVVVETLSPDEIRDGLTADQIKTDVELRLRKAGITVGSTATMLYIQPNLLKGDVSIDGVYAYNVMVSLDQLITVDLNKVAEFASTWSISTVGLAGRNNMPRSVRNAVDDLVDKFLNAYLSVNPK